MTGALAKIKKGGFDPAPHDWAFGSDLIGKVVGIYRPGASEEPPNGRA